MEPVKITTRLPQDVWERVSKEAELRQISKQEVIIAKLREPSGITELSMTEKLDRLMNAVESLQVKVDNIQCQQPASIATPIPASHEPAQESQQQASPSFVREPHGLTKEEFVNQYPERFLTPKKKVSPEVYNKTLLAGMINHWEAPDGRKWRAMGHDWWVEVNIHKPTQP